MSSLLDVVIVYVAEDKAQVYINCTLPENSRVSDALGQSDFYNKYPEAKNFPLGIFSKRVDLDTLLKAGDRIEIYRPLIHDPKDNRRLKAKRKNKRR